MQQKKAAPLHKRMVLLHGMQETILRCCSNGGAMHQHTIVPVLHPLQGSALASMQPLVPVVRMLQRMLLRDWNTNQLWLLPEHFPVLQCIAAFPRSFVLHPLLCESVDVLLVFTGVNLYHFFVENQFECPILLRVMGQAMVHLICFGLRLHKTLYQDF